ncbi:AAA family ATPase [Spirillospora sp. NPDC047279]|uniref:nSTAND1 domain-containing NTPase n=1 Tax=Spirillospora sp. NPDC047279 TaxID=3155478 RepID=UPI003411AC21
MGEWDEGGEACPYQGLAPFGPDEAGMFFGRTRATQNLLERLGARVADGGAILLVSGPSGVGKSSLLRAGLMPALAQGALPGAGAERRRGLLVTPTATPLRALAEAWTASFGGDVEQMERRLGELRPRVPLADLPGRPVLVVDQFEELFTLVADEKEREAYIRALHAMTEGPHGAAVVACVRADYWDRCAAYPRFAEAIQDGQVIVEPMTESDLRLAITGPAAAVGVEIQPGLVETVLGELRTGLAVGDRYEAGALPLLSQALRNTWDRRENGTLTIRGYEQSGQIRDSVRRTADGILERLGAEDRKAALRLLRRMTLITAGGHVARRTATLAEIHAAASARSPEERRRVEALLSEFAGQRLLIMHQDTVEIAHDTLLTAWPTLRRWLEPDLIAQAVYDRLVEDAGRWAGNHRDPAYLYRGARLLSVDDVRPRWERDPDSFPPPGPSVEAFVSASESWARRSRRRRRLVQTGLATLTILALIAAVAAVGFANDADRQRDVAVSRRLAAQSEVTGDTALAARLAVAAWRVAPTDEARNRVLAAATSTGRGTLTGHARGVTAVAFSPDGALIATGSDDGTARIWDAASRRQRGAPITLPPRLCIGGVEVAFAPDGRTLATACGTAVWFWDPATRRAAGGPIVNGAAVSALAFHPDGSLLVTGDAHGVVRLWDTATRRPRGAPMGRPDRRPGRPAMINAVAFTRDGGSLATAGADKAARLWDVATSRPLGNPFTGHTQAVTGVAFSPDQATLATVALDGTARLWKVVSREQVGVLRDPPTPFNSITFSPDGTRLATAGGIGRTVVWDAASRQRVLTLSDNAGGVEQVVFSPDGRLLAAGGDDGVVRLADPWIHTQVGGPIPARGTVALSPDGRTLAAGASGNANPGIGLWNASTLRPAGPPLIAADARRPVAATTFTPDGRSLLASGPEGLRLWDVAGRREIAHDGTLQGTAELSPTGTFAAVHHDGAIAIWDVARRRESGPRIRVSGHTDLVTAMAISPDGATLATTGFDDRVRLFDVAARRQIEGSPPPAGGGLVNDLAFGPGGRTLALTAADSTVRFWDVARHRPVGTALVPRGGAISALAYSPDGQILATGSTDRDLQLWDLRTYRPLGAPMDGHARGVIQVAYGRDGKTVATVSGDGTARLWRVGSPPDPVAAACANAGRPLDRSEWAIHVPEEKYRRTCP